MSTVMTHYSDVQPLSPEYKRPEPTVLDKARPHEVDGTGLYDQTGILATVSYGDAGPEHLKKLNNLEAFRAAAHMIKGAGVEVSYDQDYLGPAITSANTDEVLAAGKERRSANLVGAVVLHGATEEQLHQALMDLYDQSESGAKPPRVNF